VTAAPIWAAGPSLPAEPPKAIVMIVATSLTGTTAALILKDMLIYYGIEQSRLQMEINIRNE
jgi:hypothetical protein